MRLLVGMVHLVADIRQLGDRFDVFSIYQAMFVCCVRTVENWALMINSNRAQ